MIKSYFVYDRREEHVYEQYEEMSSDEEEDGDSDQEREARGGIDSPQTISAQIINEPAQSQRSELNPDQSSLREWAVASRLPALKPPQAQESQRVDSSQLSPPSRNLSDDLSMDQPRKRVESFEVDYKEFSPNDSLDNDSQGQAQRNIFKKCFLRSFDSVNQVEDDSNKSNKDDLECISNPLTSPLPPIRKRIRSSDLSIPASPAHPNTDSKHRLKPINEEEEHYYD